MIALLAAAHAVHAASVAVSEDRIAVARGDVVVVVALADGRPIARWTTGRYRPDHVAFSGDRLAAWGPEGVLVWSDTRLEVASAWKIGGPVTPLGDALLLEASPWHPTWFDLRDFDAQWFNDLETRVGEAELQRCVPLPDERHVACGGDPGPACAGTLRTWAEEAVPLGLCEVAAATPDGLLGRDATGAWAWRRPDGGVLPLPQLPVGAEVAVGPTAFVSAGVDTIEVFPRDGAAPRTFALPTEGFPAPATGGIVVGGRFGAIRLDPATGEILAAYPTASVIGPEPPRYAGVVTHRETPFARDAGRLAREGPDDWVVAPRPGGLQVRRGWRVKRDLAGVWEPLDARDRLLVLARRGGREQVVGLRPGGVAWRRAMPEHTAADVRFVGDALVVVLPAGVARLDPATGEVLWTTRVPWGVAWVLEEGLAP